MQFALIGFGEAGSILGEDLVAARHEVATFDVLLASSAGMREKAARVGVRAAEVAQLLAHCLRRQTCARATSAHPACLLHR